MYFEEKNIVFLKEGLKEQSDLICPYGPSLLSVPRFPDCQIFIIRRAKRPG